MPDLSRKYSGIAVCIALVMLAVVFGVWGDVIFNPRSISILDYNNLEYEYGTTGNTISWTITGTRVEGEKTYEIMLNDNAVDNGSWSEGETISFNVDGLSLGTHVYTIRATAGDTITSGYTVRVTVIPIIPKIEISTSGYLQYEEGSIGNNISWTIIGIEVDSGSYQITRNGSNIDSGGWVNGSPVEISVDGLDIGSYNYTLSATSGTVDPQEASIDVSVIPSSERIEISSASTFGYEINSTGNFISWTINGINLVNGFYQITFNGSTIDSAGWSDGETVITNVDGLPLGSYTYTLEATGGTADPQEKSIVVTVMTEEEYSNYTPPDNNDDDGDYNNGVAGYPPIFLITIGIIVTVFYFRRYKKKSIF